MKKLITLPDDFIYEFELKGAYQWLDWDIISQKSQDQLTHQSLYDPNFVPFKMSNKGSLYDCYKDLTGNVFYVVTDGKFVARGVIDWEYNWPRYSMPALKERSWETYNYISYEAYLISLESNYGIT